MATPVVTGTLALWLEANPMLTMEEAKEIMRQTAKHDVYTGDIPSYIYGLGKLDTTAGLYEILEQISSFKTPSSEFRYIYDQESKIIRFFSDIIIEKIYLYSASGKLLNILNLPGKEFHLDLDPNTLYLMKVCTKNDTKILKLSGH